jgi:hypothetical protein
MPVSADRQSRHAIAPPLHRRRSNFRLDSAIHREACLLRSSLLVGLLDDPHRLLLSHPITPDHPDRLQPLRDMPWSARTSAPG